MNRLSRVTAALAIVSLAGAGAFAEGIKLRLAGAAYRDTQDAGLKQPEGIAFTPGNILVVADTGNARIVEFTITEDAMVAGKVFQVPELGYPIRVAATSNGELLVLDGRQRRVGRLSAEGAFAGFVKPAVEGDLVIRSLRVDKDDAIWMLDIGRPRVIVTDLSGKLVREIALPAEPGVFFSDLDIDRSGNLFLLDSVGRRIFAVKPGAQAVEPFGVSFRDDLSFATAIAVDGSGHVFVADQNGGGIVTLAADGSFRGRQSGLGWKEGLIRYPSALTVDKLGRLFIADRGNNRVQVFTIVQ